MTTLEMVATCIIIISSLSALSIATGLYFGLEPRNNMSNLMGRFKDMRHSENKHEDNLEDIEDILLIEKQSFVGTDPMRNRSHEEKK